MACVPEARAACFPRVVEWCVQRNLELRTIEVLCLMPEIRWKAGPFA